MKRVIFTTVLCFLSLVAFAQKIIESPRFAATTARNVVVTRIELEDTRTILSFSVTMPVGTSIRIPKESFIQSSAGGERLNVISSEGIEMIKDVFMPKEGVIKYSLLFPALGPTVTMIDFGEGGTQVGSTWFIYNLELATQRPVSIFPEALGGNWFNTNGSRQWTYGFMDKAVILNSQVYFNPVLSQDGDLYKLTATRDGKVVVLYCRQAADDDLLIGPDPGSLQLFSRDPISKAGYFIPGDDEFHLPIFNPDTATYSGYVRGYAKNMGDPGLVYVNEMVGWGMATFPIHMSEDGTFSIKIPLNYPALVTVHFFDINNWLFLEPGKTTFQLLDLSQSTKQGEQPKKLVMGGTAAINNDLIATAPVLMLNDSLLIQGASAKSLPEFKDWVLGMMNQELDSLNSFILTCPISKKALQLRQNQIRLKAFGSILSYDGFKNYNYQFNPLKAPKMAEEPEAGFFSFMAGEYLNDPLLLISGSEYTSVITSLQASKQCQPQPADLFHALSDSITQQGIKLSEAEQTMLTTIITKLDEDKSRQIARDVIEKWAKFSENHRDLIASINSAIGLDKIQKGLTGYYGIKPGLITDIIIAQGKMILLSGETSIFSPSEEQSIKRTITTPFIADYLLSKNKMQKEKLDAKLLENKAKTGYFLNKTPDVKPDALFDAITHNYLGKVVFIDFWATWCGPCRQGMERMKPLKDEYDGKDIVFLYITDPSSPQATFDMMIPDIRGQHYKLTSDQSKFIYKKFKINSIPRYMLISKAGKLISRDLGTKAHTNEELKKLFDEYLDQ